MRTDHPHRRFLISCAAVALVLAVLAVIGVIGLVRGPSTSSETIRQDSPHATRTQTATRVASPEAIVGSSEPRVFARRLVSALFTWDSRGDDGVSAWAQRIVDVADPDEAPAVASDVRGYLPDLQVWQQLRSYGTRQWLEIQTTDVPTGWSTVQAQAASGDLPPGATAFTINGIRHREGTWGTHPIKTTGQVQFTVFVACPSGEYCRLLRISQLDHALR